MATKAPSKKSAARPDRQEPLVLNGGRLSLAQVMERYGYQDPKNAWSAIKAAGIPYIRISARRAFFREEDLRRWEDSRVVGGNFRIGGAA